MYWQDKLVCYLFQSQLTNNCNWMHKLEEIAVDLNELPIRMEVTCTNRYAQLISMQNIVSRVHCALVGFKSCSWRVVNAGIRLTNSSNNSCSNCSSLILLFVRIILTWQSRCDVHCAFTYYGNFDDRELDQRKIYYFIFSIWKEIAAMLTVGNRFIDIYSNSWKSRNILACVVKLHWNSLN